MIFSLEKVKFKGTFRPYQQNVLHHLKHYASNNKIHIVAPPGSGKTTLGLEIIRILNKKALILTPSITIREQWIERFQQSFLAETEDKEQWISSDLKKDVPILCITYQALHSAFMNSNAMVQIDEEGVEEITDDYQNFCLIDKLKEYHIQTICLDECHHLKNEWWKVLETTIQSLDDIQVISLTATPPYDSSKNEWQRYINLCGPIDDEIFTCELIQNKNLSPHQDFIYFNFPTDEENMVLEKFYRNVQKIYEKYEHDEKLIALISTNQFYKNYREFKNKYYTNPDYYRSLILFKIHNHIPVPNILRKLVKTEKFSIRHLEIIFQNILFQECPEEFKDFLLHLKKELIAYGLLLKRKVNFIENDKIEKLLQQSRNKLNSIVDIVSFEYENLASSMRMLILADFIKKDQKKSINLEKEIKSIGTVPIFEILRRQNFKDLKMCLLTGSLVIVPNDYIEKFHQYSIQIQNINESEYSEIQITDTNRKKIVSIITQMFQDGYFQIIIGTKSLLGEGWDSPCINSLVMASFVGSYVLSNQARGRAIRRDDKNPDKVANIYHLVCLNPYQEEANSDYENVKRRCKTFLGVAYYYNRIEDGCDRLSLPVYPYTKEKIFYYNQEIFKQAKNRTGTSLKWQHCIEDSYHVEDVCNCFIINAKRIQHSYTFYSSIVQFLLAFILQFMILEIYLHIEFKIAAILVLTLMSLANFLFIGKISFRIYFLINKVNKLKYIGYALFSALKSSGVIQSPNVKIHAFKSEKNRYVIFLKNATTYEQNIFIESLKQLFGNLENTRYFLAKPKTIAKREFFVVPDIFKKNKESALIFKRAMDRLFGHYELVFSKNDYGKFVALYAQYLYTTRFQKELFLTKRILLPNDENLKKSLEKKELPFFKD